jgi:hypothetical protein
MDWLSIAIEEYKTLRNESLLSMQTQQSTLRAGTAAVSVIIASGFSLWDSIELLSEIIFLAFVPIICYLVLTIWMGEVLRMMRAGKYLSDLENKINKKLKEKPEALIWENSLRKKDAKTKTPQMLFNYLCIIGLFFTLAIGSVIIGNYKIWAKISHLQKLIINIPESLLFIFFFARTLIQGWKFRKEY